MATVSSENLNLIARCWIRYHADPETRTILKNRLPEPDYKKTLSHDGDIWPYDIDPESVLIRLGFRSPDSVFEIVLKIAELTDDEWLLAVLAAGPLEELVKFHKDSEKYLERYKELATSDPKHAKILSMVWL